MTNAYKEIIRLEAEKLLIKCELLGDTPEITKKVANEILGMAMFLVDNPLPRKLMQEKKYLAA